MDNNEKAQRETELNDNKTDMLKVLGIDKNTSFEDVINKVMHHNQRRLPEQEILYAFLDNETSRPKIINNVKLKWFKNAHIRACMKILFNAYNTTGIIHSHQVHSDLYTHLTNIRFDDCIGEYWQGSIGTIKQRYYDNELEIMFSESHSLYHNNDINTEQKLSIVNNMFSSLQFEIDNEQEKKQTQKLDDTLQYIKDCQSGDIQFTQWGIDGLDDIAKLRTNSLWFIGALPGTGKTSLAISAIINQCRAGKHVFLWCGEMTEEQILLKFISQISNVDLMRMEEENTLHTHELQSIMQAVQEMMTFKLTTRCGKPMNINQILAVAKAVHADDPLDCAWLDYYSDIQPVPEMIQQTKQEHLGYVSTKLKEFKMEIGIPTILLAQLKRESQDRYLRKTDLAESSSAEQCADGVICLDRPKKGRDVNERNYWINNREIKLSELYDNCALVIAKNRFGAETTIVNKFYGNTMSFGECIFSDYKPQANIEHPFANSTIDEDDVKTVANTLTERRDIHG